MRVVCVQPGHCVARKEGEDEEDPKHVIAPQALPGSKVAGLLEGPGPLTNLLVYSWGCISLSRLQA